MSQKMEDSGQIPCPLCWQHKFASFDSLLDLHPPSECLVGREAPLRRALWPLLAAFIHADWTEYAKLAPSAITAADTASVGSPLRTFGTLLRAILDITGGSVLTPPQPLLHAAESLPRSYWQVLALYFASLSTIWSGSDLKGRAHLAAAAAAAAVTGGANSSDNGLLTVITSAQRLLDGVHSPPSYLGLAGASREAVRAQRVFGLFVAGDAAAAGAAAAAVRGGCTDNLLYAGLVCVHAYHQLSSGRDPSEDIRCAIRNLPIIKGGRHGAHPLAPSSSARLAGVGLAARLYELLGRAKQLKGGHDAGVTDLGRAVELYKQFEENLSTLSANAPFLMSPLKTGTPTTTPLPILPHATLITPANAAALILPVIGLSRARASAALVPPARAARPAPPARESLGRIRGDRSFTEIQENSARRNISLIERANMDAKRSMYGSAHTRARSQPPPQELPPSFLEDFVIDHECSHLASDIYQSHLPTDHFDSFVSQPPPKRQSSARSVSFLENDTSFSTALSDAAERSYLDALPAHPVPPSPSLSTLPQPLMFNDLGPTRTREWREQQRSRAARSSCPGENISFAAPCPRPHPSSVPRPRPRGSLAHTPPLPPAPANAARPWLRPPPHQQPPLPPRVGSNPACTAPHSPYRARARGHGPGARPYAPAPGCETMTERAVESLTASQARSAGTVAPVTAQAATLVGSTTDLAASFAWGAAAEGAVPAVWSDGVPEGIGKGTSRFASMYM